MEKSPKLKSHADQLLVNKTKRIYVIIWIEYILNVVTRHYCWSRSVGFKCELGMWLKYSVLVPLQKGLNDWTTFFLDFVSTHRGTFIDIYVHMAVMHIQTHIWT